MPQVSPHPLSKAVHQKVAEIFLETIIRTDSKTKASLLINDLLTPTERVMIAKRLAIAYLLEKGWQYRTISQTLKVSLATIARIANITKKSGQGFKNVIARMLEDQVIVSWFDQIETIISALPAKIRQKA